MPQGKVWFYGDEGYKPKKGSFYMSHDLPLVTKIGVVFMPSSSHRGDPQLPTKGSDQSAGWDIRNNLNYPIRMGPGERKLFPTGLRLMIPDGYEIQVRPRSGLALKKGLTVLNTPGTIDSDYTGEVGVVIINHSKEVQVVEAGDRIAQLVVKKVETVEFALMAEADKDTSRGSGGFGSTGA